jgi:hypothetical protein
MSPTLVKSVARPKVQIEVELGIEIDRTGSTKQFEVGVPPTFDIISSIIVAKARSMKVWVASHGDLDEGQPWVLHTDGGSREQAFDDIRRIDYAGGGDPLEHHIDGVETLLRRLPWTTDRSRARGAIVLFATADSKPAKSGISARALGEEIRNAGILLYAICEPAAKLRELVSTASGLMFQITNNPDPKELQQIGSQVAASIVATMSAGGTVPMTVPV